MNRNIVLPKQSPDLIEIQSADKKLVICPELWEIIQRTRDLTNEKILRLPQVKERTGRSNATIWKDIKNGTLPPPLRLGARSVGWKNSEISAWIEARALASRTDHPVDMEAFVACLITSRNSPDTS